MNGDPAVADVHAFTVNVVVGKHLLQMLFLLFVLLLLSSIFLLLYMLFLALLLLQVFLLLLALLLLSYPCS